MRRTHEENAQRERARRTHEENIPLKTMRRTRNVTYADEVKNYGEKVRSKNNE